ncbi:MAG: prepilin-type N-terminal cleavage/methylation domain-containing protein [Actinobacteria bacterium]|nr:prepilin-type N-terminal cleavage/methylation domain-containing protein [Actinomycetota bacterium]
MMHLFVSRRGDDGFTLVETLAALLVFALMTMGLVPLLISSLQGADLSRSVTINKNAAVEAMERVRGLPYYVSFGAQNNKVDVLDLYFPKLAVEQAGWGQLYGAYKYTTDCSNATLANPACPRNIPDGTTLRFEAFFVDGSGALVDDDFPAAYTWDSTTGTDVPPSQMLDMTITAMWTQRGRARSFKLQSLIGDRRFSGIKVRGDANVEFGVQVLTSYSNDAGELSELLALGGKADSSIESRGISSADISVRAADVRLSNTATELAGFGGAAASYHAPPDITPGATNATGGTVTHTEVFDPVSPSELMQVAGVDNTSAGTLHARVANEQPSSAGTFSYSPGLGALDFWVRTQVDPSNNDLRKLDVTQPAFSIRGKAFRGTATGVTRALEAADRGVETSATLSLIGPTGTGLRILPTSFIAAQDSTFGGALIQISNFVAETTCEATDDPTSASATATWSADLRYWVADLDPTDEIVQPGYQVLNLTGGPGGDPLEVVMIENPLVYDGNTPAEDVYLFEDFDDPDNPKNGYLVHWSSLRNVAGTEDPTGRLTRAQIAGALIIDTARTNPAIKESGLNVQIGQLGCEAVDER